MPTIKYRAKIEKIDGDEIRYSLPTRVYPRNVPEFEKFDLADPLTLKSDFLEIEKIFYLGNKNRLRKQFSEMIPKDVKTVFDPMCGGSSFLAELAEHGKSIIANDYSTAPFFVSRAMFLNSKPDEKQFEEFMKSVKNYEGYYFQNAKKLFPIVAGKKRVQKYIDGYIHQAHEVKFGNFYLGVLSACLLYWFGSFGGPYRRWSFSQFQHQLKNYSKQLLKYNVTGCVTNLDALKMDIPDVDMIFFDPPYSDKMFKYVIKFGKLNSILLQKDWKLNEVTQEEVAKLAEKLSAHCKYLFVATSSECPIKWKPLFSELKRQASKKTFYLSGTGGVIASNLSSAKKNVRKIPHILWTSVRKSLYKSEENSEEINTERSIDLEKAIKDPFMIYPDESKEYKYMIHTHARGRSIHGDLRIENLGKEFLIGWTLMIARAGTVKEPILTMSDLRKINVDSTKYYKINLQTGEWATREKKGAEKSVRIELVATRKAPEPIEWATFEGVSKPGVVGATKEYPGVFIIVDKGKAEYLSQKSWFHEYWFNGKVLKNGRYFFRQLRAWKTKKSDSESDQDQQKILGNDGLWDYMKEQNQESIEILKSRGMTDEQIQEWIEPQLTEIATEMNLSKEEIRKAFVIPPGKEKGIGPEVGWLFINPDDQIPYVLSMRAIEQKWLPPETVSALPKHWRKHVKDDERYWMVKDKGKALELRKALVERWKEEKVLSKAAQSNRNPFSGKEIKIKKARHRRDQCMDCSAKPVIEILWAEGVAHAWFCWTCFVKWLGEDPDRAFGKRADISSAKLINNGEAAKKFAENRNPNIKEDLTKLFSGKEVKGTAEEFKILLETLAIEKTSVSTFRFTYQFWNGPKTVREGPTRSRFLLWIEFEKKYLTFRLNESIVDVDKTGAMLMDEKWSESEYKITGYVKPGTPLNQTKNTPSFIRLMDSGKAIILIDDSDLKKIQFTGKELKGIFLFKRAEDHWYLERVEGGP